MSAAEIPTLDYLAHWYRLSAPVVEQLAEAMRQGFVAVSGRTAEAQRLSSAYRFWCQRASQPWVEVRHSGVFSKLYVEPVSGLLLRREAAAEVRRILEKASLAIYVGDENGFRVERMPLADAEHLVRQIARLVSTAAGSNEQA